MDTHELVDAICQGDKERADAAFGEIMRTNAVAAVEVATPEISDSVFNKQEQ
jgi:hypothetical protein